MLHCKSHFKELLHKKFLFIYFFVAQKHHFLVCSLFVCEFSQIWEWASGRGLHGLKTEARTRPVPEIVWPNPSRPERHS